MSTFAFLAFFLIVVGIPVIGGFVSKIHKANIELAFNQAAAIDLAGRDVFEAVQVSVNPKVINTPKVAAMAKL